MEVDASLPLGRGGDRPIQVKGFPTRQLLVLYTDGLIEAYYDPKARFLAGLQFHPERMLEARGGNLRIWQAFAKAARKKPDA